MMKTRVRHGALLFTLLLSLRLGAAAQEGETYVPAPLASPTPLVKPILLPVANSAAIDDLLPTPTPVFQHQGVYVQTLNGRVVMEQASDEPFNPASAVKLITALDALRTYGPEHRFTTVLWTNGAFDQATGTVTGDLVVSGRDPSFHYVHAIRLARELNRMGVRTVTGDLIVSPGFTMNFSSSARGSGGVFYDTLDATRRPAAAVRALSEECRAKNDPDCYDNAASVAVMGAVVIGNAPQGARVLLTHRSSQLVDLLKVLLCYSNNFMAERLGESLGGPTGLQSFLVKEIGLGPSEVRLASASGLGINRLSPRSMMRIYVALRAELAKSKLVPSDIMPVAGVDPGTLQKRYTSPAARGSVVGKTGTLGRTDGGVSALVGETRTQSGETLLFVIFNRRGSVYRFRQDQDTLVTSLQWARGGPAPFAYTPHALALRLADTELQARSAKNEYESISNDER